MDDFDSRLAQQAIAEYKAAMDKADIVVTVSGGVVTSVRTRGGKESHVIIDYDDIESEYPNISGAVEELVDSAFVVTRTLYET